MAGIAYSVPIAFSACQAGSLWCSVAYAITSSGGTKGFFALLLVTGFCYTLSQRSLKQKVIVFLKSVLSLCVFFGALAYVNEHYTKPVLKARRPSHSYMLSHTGREGVMDSLYSLNKKERGAYFGELVKNNPASFSNIDERIRAHWVEEAGFSFPSGHTFNAFLFAIIIAYAIYYNRSFPRLRQLFVLPFIWALLVGISRVAIGAHSALDVTAGAALGLLVGTLFLYIDLTRHWLTRKH